MIYLIIDAYLDKDQEPRKCLKIGYARNIEDRMVGYGTSNNLNVILLDTREGGYGLEKLFHYRYRDKIIKIKGNREWMEYDEEIVREFKSLTTRELFLNYFSDDKERQLKELIFDYFIGEDEESLNFVLNCRKSRENFLIKDYLSSPIYFMGDVINLINQLQEQFNVILEDNVKESFISSFRDKFDIKEISEFDGEIREDPLVEEGLVEKMNDLKEIYEANGLFETKMRSICDFLLINPKWYGHVLDLGWLPLNMRNYLIQLGPKRIKAIGYREVTLKREISNILGDDSIRKELVKLFEVGKRYLLRDIKDTLREVYKSLGLTKTPKASDLEEYFEVKEVNFYNSDTKKRARGYEIISLKE